MDDLQPKTDAVDPVDGGCWYCHRDDGGDMYLCCEFDCDIHLHCIQDHVAGLISRGNYVDLEAEIIVREFRTLLEEHQRPDDPPGVPTYEAKDWKPAPLPAVDPWTTRQPLPPTEPPPHG